MSRVLKADKRKAEFFSKYARDKYNEDRALLATFGSAGYLTFADDIELAINALEYIGDNYLADLIKNKQWMQPCGSKLVADKASK